MANSFGITLKQYDEMLDAQGSRCAICGKTPEDNGRRLAVDHDHNTGEIRGLLCVSCNMGLGKFGDDPTLIAKAIAYLLQIDL